MSRSAITVLLLTALGPMAWGTTYLVTTELLPSGRPLFVALCRALPIGLLILMLTRQLPNGRWWWRAFVLGSLNIGMFFPLLFVAAYRLPGGVAATIGAVQPLLVALLSWVLLSEAMSKLRFLAAGLGVAGVALLVLKPEARFDQFGILAALVATGLMAIGTVLGKRWGRPVPLMSFTAWQLVAGGILLLPIAFLVEGLPPALNMMNMIGLLYLGVVNTGMAYACWFFGMQRLRATELSFLALLSPLVATCLGWLILNQQFTSLQILGIGLLLTGILVGQMRWQARAQEAKRKITIQP